MKGTPDVQRRHFLARAMALVSGGWLAGKARRAEAAPQSDMPFLGEIRMFAGSFAPLGWAKCDGQLLSIADYDALFSLLGTTYGGDGVVSFGLPDLRGRAPVHAWTTVLGEVGGQETVVLTLSQIPAHSHALMGSSGLPDMNDPMGRVPARNPFGWPHYNINADTTLASNALAVSGGSQPHNNMMPSLCINFIICIEGLFPTQ